MVFYVRTMSLLHIVTLAKPSSSLCLSSFAVSHGAKQQAISRLLSRSRVGLNLVNGQFDRRTHGRNSSTTSKLSSSLPPVPPHGHRVVLMRHGESEFNNANIFTGWCDVALTPRGVVEAVEAGQVFASHGLSFRKCYSSLLTRSIATANRALEAAGIAYTPLSYDWRFNERHYGALQGLSKERTADRLGYSRVMKWRRSYDARPPLMTQDHPHYEMIEHDGRYGHLHQSIGITKGESLQDCQRRVIEVWEDTIIREICDDAGVDEEGDQPYTLVVAHANSLRALVMHLDNIHPDEIEDVNIPTAMPFFYDIDIHSGTVIRQENGGSRKNGSKAPIFTGRYITDKMKKRNFLERRRAAQDPWLWALHDEDVAPGMLLKGGEEKVEEHLHVSSGEEEGSMEGLEVEAARNTEMFAKNLGHSAKAP